MVDVHLNRLNWFHFLILVGGPLVILIGCIVFLSPSLGVLRKSFLNSFFLLQLDCGILSLYNNDELFFVVWLTGERRLVLFPAEIIVRDRHLVNLQRAARRI